MDNVTINVYEEYCLIDIMNKCPYAKDLLSDDNINEAVNDLQRVFCYCQQVPPVFMVKSYDAIEEHSKVSYTNEAIAKQILSKIIIGTAFRDSKPKPYSLWNVFMDHQLKFTVKALKFYSDDKQVFSYFRGYDYKQLDEVKKEVIEPFLNHVKDVIANGNDDIYKYILIWIASILQKPNFKTGTALVILGNQGTGKNVFTNVICKLMARYANENVTSIESVVGKFNAVLENKKLIILNELQSIDSNKFLNSDALKSIITDRAININQKNEPERKCENVCNFMMVSNNDIPIKIEATDRRYLVTKTSDARRGDFDYFDRLCDSFTPEFYEHLFTFFMMMDVSKTNLRKIPSTDAKETIKEASLSSYELFARECYNEINNVTGPDLFNMYCEFVERNKFKTCSSRTFVSNIKRFTGEAKSKRVNGKVCKAYSLLPEFYEEFKKYHEDLEKLIVNDEPDPSTY